MLTPKNRARLNVVMMAAGVVIMAFSYRLFLVDNRIAPGGFTGLATIFHYLFGWPIGTMVIAMNIPLFAIGMRVMGFKFGLRSFVCMIVSSLLIDYLPDCTITSDLFIASIFGGIMLGLGLGLILAGGATTGGSDLAAMLLQNRIRAVSLGWVLFAIDAVVVVLSGITFDAMMALYSMVALFLSARIVDMVQEGFISAKMFIIISAHPKEIADRIMTELERGVTGLSGTGMYSGTDRQVLLCVVNRMEITRMKNLVAQEDPEAFVIVSDVRETLGEGFSPAVPPSQ